LEATGYSRSYAITHQSLPNYATLVTGDFFNMVPESLRTISRSIQNFGLGSLGRNETNVTNGNHFGLVDSSNAHKEAKLGGGDQGDE
jgi:hypothetical protein